MQWSFIPTGSVLDSYFAEWVMSVHFKEGVHVLKKKWRPGAWEAEISKEIISKEQLEELIHKLFAEAQSGKDQFLEIDKPLSKVLQLWPYRVVIVYAPLADGLEMTVVRPVKKLSFADYQLDEKLAEHLTNKAKGILISGAPGEGKTTFAQAIAEQYSNANKIVKTLESPRDLIVPDQVVQYSFTYWGHDEVRDILLLSRPDVAFYDEVRNKQDFELFADLRLTGIGLIGVTHATKAVDSIQRFVWHVELGIIPQVIDTVVFIEAGKIAEVLVLDLVVKVPHGMMSEDLARPVIQVSSLLTKKLMYEIYSFGEQIVVMEVSKVDAMKDAKWVSPIDTFASYYLQDYFQKKLGVQATVKVNDTASITVYVDESDKWSVIGKWGEKIQALEKKLGVGINLRDHSDMIEESFEDTNIYEDTNESSYMTMKGKRPDAKVGGAMKRRKRR